MLDSMRAVVEKFKGLDRNRQIGLSIFLVVYLCVAVYIVVRRQVDRREAILRARAAKSVRLPLPPS
jgi:hypothetical protein